MSFDIIFYFSLSILSVLFGIFYFVYPRLSSISFLVLGMMIPTSNQFMDFTSLSGVYFYDYFFFTLILYYIIRIIIKKNFLKSNFLNFILIVTFFISYLIFFILSSGTFDKYLLRDFRPFLTLLYGFICIDLLRNNNIKLAKIINVLIIVFIFKLLFFFFLQGFSFSDLYYQDNLFRYFDATTFIAALFLIVIIFKRNSFSNVVSNYKITFVIILAILIVLISNLRVLIFALIFSYLIVNKGFFRKLIPAFIFIFLFIFYSYFMQIERVTSAYSVNDILIQFGIRFYPALEKISLMNWHQYIYGLGFGTYFDIPWFEYRGLDGKLNTIDSTYLTFFAKYGIFSIILIFMFFRVLLSNINDISLKKAILFFYLILFVTMSILYQSGAVLHILFLNILMISINHEDITHSISINS